LFVLLYVGGLRLRWRFVAVVLLLLLLLLVVYLPVVPFTFTGCTVTIVVTPCLPVALRGLLHHVVIVPHCDYTLYSLLFGLFTPVAVYAFVYVVITFCYPLLRCCAIVVSLDWLLFGYRCYGYVYVAPLLRIIVTCCCIVAGCGYVVVVWLRC